MNTSPLRISSRNESWNVLTCLVFAAILTSIVLAIAYLTPLGSTWWEWVCMAWNGMGEPAVGQLRGLQPLSVYLAGLTILAFLFITGAMVVLLPSVAAMVWITGPATPRKRRRSYRRR